MSKMRSDAFDVDLFETRLESLKDTQEGIQQMSSWCLQQRAHHKKIVSCWLNVFKRVRIEHRLVLFYLANDVIQYSKRKHYEYVESWATALQRATTMVRDEKVKSKILRIFHIWEQREIYSEEFISDLHGLLNINPSRKSNQPSPEASDDFQNTTLISNVRECVELSHATDMSFKKLPKAPCCDIENIKQQLKDKSHSEDVGKEIERYMAYIEAYNKNLQAEIKSRRAVLSSLDAAIKFYSNQRGEVKVVVGAYKNFGSRIKLVKKKLDEIIPNLASPIPSPDINAPSPEPDADLQLPDENNTISMSMFSKNSFNGYSSYLDGKLPFDINDFKRDDSKASTSTPSSSSSTSQQIEVIATRPDNQTDSFNSSVEYYKPESINTYPSTSSIEIPGLAPLPVPPVPQSEYTSLARTAQQYGIIQAPHPNIFANNNLNHGYNSLLTTYSRTGYNLDNNRNATPLGGLAGGVSVGRGGAVAGSGGIPHMPPPMALNTIDGNGNNNRNVTGSTASIGSSTRNPLREEFNSTWDMNMSWNQLDTSNNSSSVETSFNVIDTELSFERKNQSNENSGIIYSENSLAPIQDVDHRQLHLTAVADSLGIKLGLSKEKSRQLDIDHRNLISLTGSPSVNDDSSSCTPEKKSWMSSEDRDFRTNTGDIDYRGIGQAIKTINTTPLSEINVIRIMEPPPLPPGYPQFNTVSESPNKVLCQVSDSSQNNTNSPSSKAQKDEASVAGGGESGSNCGGYDPADMVIDMDMSDEDLEEIFREVKTTDVGSGGSNAKEVETLKTLPTSTTAKALGITTATTTTSTAASTTNSAIVADVSTKITSVGGGDGGGEATELVGNKQHMPLSDKRGEEEVDQPLKVDANSKDIRPPLLETPSEFSPQNNNAWTEQTPSGQSQTALNVSPNISMAIENIADQQKPQQHRDNEGWDQTMSYQEGGCVGGGGGGVDGNSHSYLLPHPPHPMHSHNLSQEHISHLSPSAQSHQQHRQHQYQPQFMSGGHGDFGVHPAGPRGRGRGWGHLPQNPFRNAPRPRGAGGVIGGVGGNPYFNNRVGRGAMRAPYRGKFRGSNSWI